MEWGFNEFQFINFGGKMLILAEKMLILAGKMSNYTNKMEWRFN
jgi:hypothetical protein